MLALSALPLLAVHTAAGAGDDTPAAPAAKSELLGVSSVVYPPERCDDGLRAITYYRRAYAAHRAKMRADGPVPRVWYHRCDVVQRRAAEWRDRAASARVELAKWREFHFDWRAWLPGNWYAVGRCETGYGGAPNFAHQNSSFVSAFGISRRAYPGDARVYGVPSWPSYEEQKRGVPLPTPREQLLAAMGHYRLHGDGWGCPGP